jgi:SNF1-activating kinase 1
MSPWDSSIVSAPFLPSPPHFSPLLPVHHQGIIHRDIKPANLLWTEDRQSVKICDFGVSHFTAAAAQHDPRLYDEAGLTKTAGSPAFFAPEICDIPNISFDDSPSSPTFQRGSQSSISPISPSSQNPPITKQIDIWALGVTFYCLLFGKPPWQGQTEFAMFRAICNEDFHLPDTMCRDRVPTGGKDHKPEGRDVGWCVVGLLEGLLEKDQDKRITLADMKVCLCLLDTCTVTDQ